jgi:hypothetical protein
LTAVFFCNVVMAVTPFANLLNYCCLSCVAYY